jgi:nucleotide-binding universal stress UspA family protein
MRRKKIMPLFKNILVPTDYGPAAERAADFAAELAKQFHARLTLLHSWEVPLPAYAESITLPLDEMEEGARKALEIEASRVRASFPEVETLLVPGLTWRTIIDAVKERGFDLVVIGTHGRHGVVRLVLGSVAEKVVRASPVPVLTVRADERDA